MNKIDWEFHFEEDENEYIKENISTTLLDSVVEKLTKDIDKDIIRRMFEL